MLHKKGGVGDPVKMTTNPMRNAHAAPRCVAKSKRSGESAEDQQFAASWSAACTARGPARRGVMPTGTFVMARAPSKLGKK